MNSFNFKIVKEESTPLDTIATKYKRLSIVAILPSTIFGLDFSNISAIAAVVVITRKPVNVKAGFHGRRDHYISHDRNKKLSYLRVTRPVFICSI